MRLLKRFPFLFLLLVIGPGCLGTWYYLEIASEQFETEMHFIVQGNEQQSNDMLSALTGIPGGSSSAKDAFIIQDYLLSRAFLEKAQQKLDIRKHFSSSNIDQYSRVPPDYSREEFYEYWLDFLDIEHDSTAGITKVIVLAFNSDMAVKLAELILEESEQLVNHLSTRAEKDALNFAQKELLKAQNQLSSSRLAMFEFRNQTLSIDLEKTAEAKTGIVTGLESELANQEAEYARLQTYLQPGSIQLRVVKKQIAALTRQVANEKRRWAPTKRNRKSTVDNATLNEQVSQYEELVLNKTFAEKVYEAALIGMEKARIEAQQKHRYLVTTVQPQRPESSTKPERYWEIIKIWVSCLLIWAIFSLVLSSIKDHAGFA